MRITAACVDMWEPYRRSIEQHTLNCRIVYDKFHVMQHANQAVMAFAVGLPLLDYILLVRHRHTPPKQSVQKMATKTNPGTQSAD